MGEYERLAKTLINHARREPFDTKWVFDFCYDNNIDTELRLKKICSAVDIRVKFDDNIDTKTVSEEMKHFINVASERIKNKKGGQLWQN